MADQSSFDDLGERLSFGRVNHVLAHAERGQAATLKLLQLPPRSRGRPPPGLPGRRQSRAQRAVGERPDRSHPHHRHQRRRGRAVS
ncbi:hypothetical protein B005_2156 [Nocardiopsis alba ATCC BAA-2165]|uniref:Uncharacterized protein n=1 Tax=Nocardiopsis alba (strain ATCC BAA-2165 / BE74) TaxID=1205910 RepID=J7LDM2_NOCAA|nr:hypothetical protein B005_2156 [Nocardiopsis alba ATCC BAA-2165]